MKITIHSLGQSFEITPNNSKREIEMILNLLTEEQQKQVFDLMGRVLVFADQSKPLAEVDSGDSK